VARVLLIKYDHNVFPLTLKKIRKKKDISPNSAILTVNRPPLMILQVSERKTAKKIQH